MPGSKVRGGLRLIPLRLVDLALRAVYLSEPYKAIVEKPVGFRREFNLPSARRDPHQYLRGEQIEC